MTNSHLKSRRAAYVGTSDSNNQVSNTTPLSGGGSSTAVKKAQVMTAPAATTSRQYQRLLESGVQQYRDLKNATLACGDPSTELTPNVHPLHGDSGSEVTKPPRNHQSSSSSSQLRRRRPFSSTTSSDFSHNIHSNSEYLQSESEKRGPVTTPLRFSSLKFHHQTQAQHYHRSSSTTSNNNNIASSSSSSSSVSSSNHSTALKPQNLSTTTSEGFQATAAYHRGTESLKKGEGDRAVSEFSQAIKLAPNDLKSYSGRARAFMKLCRYEPAIADYTKILQRTPPNADLLQKRAWAHEKQGDVQAAIRDYTSVLEIEPTHIPARLVRGKLYKHLRHYQDALADFGHIVTSDPRFIDGYQERANVYQRLGRYELAVQDHDSVIDLESASYRGIQAPSLFARAHALTQLAHCIQNREEANYRHEKSLESVEDGSGGLESFVKEEEEEEEEPLNALFCPSQVNLSTTPITQKRTDFSKPLRCILCIACSNSGQEQRSSWVWKQQYHNSETRSSNSPESASVENPISRCATKVNPCWSSACSCLTTVRHWFRSAKTHMRGAIDDYTSILALKTPHACETYRLRGQLYHILGQLPEALVDLNQALAPHHSGLSPDNNEVTSTILNLRTTLSRALLFTHLYRLEDALVDLNATIGATSSNTCTNLKHKKLEHEQIWLEATYGRACVYVCRQEFNLALENLQQVLDHFSTTRRHAHRVGLVPEKSVVSPVHSSAKGLKPMKKSNSAPEFDIGDSTTTTSQNNVMLMVESDSASDASALEAKETPSILLISAVLIKARILIYLQRLEEAIDGYNFVLHLDARHAIAIREVQQAHELLAATKQAKVEEACRWLIENGNEKPNSSTSSNVNSGQYGEPANGPNLNAGNKKKSKKKRKSDRKKQQEKQQQKLEELETSASKDSLEKTEEDHPVPEEDLLKTRGEQVLIEDENQSETISEVSTEKSDSMMSEISTSSTTGTVLVSNCDHPHLSEPLKSNHGVKKIINPSSGNGVLLSRPRESGSLLSSHSDARKRIQRRLVERQMNDKRLWSTTAAPGGFVAPSSSSSTVLVSKQQQSSGDNPTPPTSTNTNSGNMNVGSLTNTTTTTNHEEDSASLSYNNTLLTKEVDSQSLKNNGGILVDERYLRKRRKQLEKLRGELLMGVETENYELLVMTLGRVQRKHMNEPLSSECTTAQAVVDRIENESSTDVVVSPCFEEVHEDSTTNNNNSIEDMIEPTTPRQENEDQRSTIELKEFEIQKLISQNRTMKRNYKTQMEEKNTEISILRQQLNEAHLRNLAQYGNTTHDTKSPLSCSSLPSNNHQKPPPQPRPTNGLTTATTWASPSSVVEIPDSHKYLPEDENVTQSTPAPLLSNNVLKSIPMCCRVDELIQWLGPTKESEHTRAHICEYIHTVIQNAFSSSAVELYTTGSFPIKTYLPDGDLDASILFYHHPLRIPPPAQAEWYFCVLEALCKASSKNPTHSSSSSSSTNSTSPPSKPAVDPCYVRNVTFINAEVKVIQCTINNLSVDITANQVGAFAALHLLEEFDVRVGRRHLFKKSLILIKAWCQWETRTYVSGEVLGARGGALSTYALNIMVMMVFNLYWTSLSHPIQSLYVFLEIFSGFDFRHSGVSIKGPVSMATLQLSDERTSGDGRKCLMDDAFLENLCDLEFAPEAKRRPCSGRGSSSSEIAVMKKPPSGFPTGFPIRHCNVLDPLVPSNNVARSVTAKSLMDIKKAFGGGLRRLGEILKLTDSNGGSSGVVTERHMRDVHPVEMDEFFSTLWRTYGRGDGWRPDLLIHPRQAWHGMIHPTKTSSEVSKDVDVYRPTLPPFRQVDACSSSSKR